MKYVGLDLWKLVFLPEAFSQTISSISLIVVSNSNDIRKTLNTMYSEVLLDQWHLYDSPFVTYLTTDLLVACLSSSCWVASDSCTENRHKDGICQKDFTVKWFHGIQQEEIGTIFLLLKKWQCWSAVFVNTFSTWISTWEFTVRDLLHLDLYDVKLAS
jgi:hypothetical protein